MSLVIADEDAVRSANQRFYEAFQSLELSRMDDAWWHEGQVTCIHPGWPLQAGWSAVRESWQTIFTNTEEIRLEVIDERVDLRGDFAWVVCVERLRSRSVLGESEGAVLATNVFRRDGDHWRMVHHHASPFITEDEDGEEFEDAPTLTAKKNVVN